MHAVVEEFRDYTAGWLGAPIAFYGPEETARLVGLAQGGDFEARNQVALSLLPYVVRVVRKRCDHMVRVDAGTGPGDMIHEAFIGLLDAIDRFDPNRGVKLLTYATFWIRQRLQRHLTTRGSVVAAPVHAAELAPMLRRTEAALAKELGQHPTDAQLHAALGARLSRKAAIPAVELIRAAGRAMRGAVSMSASNPGESGGRESSYAWEDPKTSDPEEAGEAKYEVLDRIHQAMEERLSTRERMVLGARFGIDREPETLTAIGRRIGVSRERVRQVEEQAMEKLRRHLAPRRPRDLVACACGCEELFPRHARRRYVDGHHRVRGTRARRAALEAVA